MAEEAHVGILGVTDLLTTLGRDTISRDDRAVKLHSTPNDGSRTPFAPKVSIDGVIYAR